MSADPEEKRRTPRIQPFVAPCTVSWNGTRMSAYLADIGLEGARVTCDAGHPEIGSWVTVDVRLPRQADRSRLAGRVKWAQPAEGRKGYTFGITFEGMSEDEQANVAGVMAEFRRLVAELS